MPYRQDENWKDELKGCDLEMANALEKKGMILLAKAALERQKIAVQEELGKANTEISQVNNDLIEIGRKSINASWQREIEQVARCNSPSGHHSFSPLIQTPRTAIPDECATVKCRDCGVEVTERYTVLLDAGFLVA